MITPKQDNKLFLIDAYALIFRAYFAFAKNPRVNSKGQNTSAAFGFTNSLIDIIKNEKPTHLAVVFDPPGGSTTRKADFPEYKAHRDETPEGIITMIQPIKDIIRAFNIPIIEVFLDRRCILQGHRTQNQSVCFEGRRFHVFRIIRCQTQRCVPLAWLLPRRIRRRAFLPKRWNCQRAGSRNRQRHTPLCS